MSGVPGQPKRVQGHVPGWVALAIVCSPFAVGIVMGYLATWDAEAEAITLRHPQSGHVIRCGPYKYIGGFGRVSRRHKSEAEGMLQRCLDGSLKDGYRRATGSVGSAV
jgi:hypothetical protein